VSALSKHAWRRDVVLQMSQVRAGLSSREASAVVAPLPTSRLMSRNDFCLAVSHDLSG
jgi:hypothetical protein